MLVEVLIENDNHGRLTNVVRNMRRFRIVCGANLD